MNGWLLQFHDLQRLFPQIFDFLATYLYEHRSHACARIFPHYPVGQERQSHPKGNIQTEEE